MKLFNADGAAGSGAAAGADGAAGAGAAAAADGGDLNYDAPTNVRGGDGTAGADSDAAAGDADAAAGEGDATAAADGEGEGEAQRPKRTLVGDLQKERATNKELKAELQRNQDLLESWKPVLQRLSGREDLQRAVVEGRITIQQAEATKANEEKAELEDIANDYGWFKDDGVTPDLAKAEKHQARIRKEAERIAGAQVQPMRQHVANQQANTRIDQAIAYCEQHGHADPEFVRAELVKVARANPDALLSDQHGNALYEMIVGKAQMQGKTFKGKAKAKASAAADAGDAGGDKVFVHTESPGGRRADGPKLTASEKALGEAYGLTDKDWQLAESHAGVRKGYTRLTED